MLISVSASLCTVNIFNVFWSLIISRITGRSILHPLFSFPLTCFWSSVLFSTPCQINISPSKTSGDKERAKCKMKWQLYTPPLSSLFNSAALVSTSARLSSSPFICSRSIIQSSFIQLGHLTSDSKETCKDCIWDSFGGIVINILAWASAFLCGREMGV